MSYQPNNRTTLISLDLPNIQSATSQTTISHGISFPEVSPHTRQEFKEESDINTIMARYMRTGELPHVNLLAPQYLDASGIDFQAHMQVVAEAKTLFNELPSNVRFRFANDPGRFIDFCSDPGNRQELAHMGLLSPEATRSALMPSTPTGVPAKPQPTVSGEAAADPSP